MCLNFSPLCIIKAVYWKRWPSSKREFKWIFAIHFVRRMGLDSWQNKQVLIIFHFIDSWNPAENQFAHWNPLLTRRICQLARSLEEGDVSLWPDDSDSHNVRCEIIFYTLSKKVDFSSISCKQNYPTLEVDTFKVMLLRTWL